MLLDKLIPLSRRNKLKLVIREKMMELQNSNQELNQFLSSNDPNEQVETYLWEYKSSVSVDKHIVDQNCTEYKQDRYINGRVDTHFHYKTSCIPNGTFLSNGATHVSIYDQDGQLLPEFSTLKYIKSRNEQLRLAPVKSASGITASLYGNVENATGNYGHWLIDALSRIYLFQRDYDLNEIDHYLVPKLTFEFQLESLIACGIPKEKIVEIDTLECVSFEKLLCVSAPRELSSGVCPGWAIDGFRTSILPNINHEKQPKRLYISRKDANDRKFTNELELIEMLETYGFESIELSNYDFAGKIELFANAECIIGLTGAGLTNLMFCPTSASILELMPRSNVNYIYSTIAGYLQINYQALVFNTEDLLSKINKYQGDLFLDPTVLEQRLVQLLEVNESSTPINWR